MIRVSTSIEVARPAGEVFAFVSDVTNNPKWQQGQRSCAWTSDPPLRVGSTYDQRARFAGRDLVTSFEVTDYEPGRRVRFTSRAGFRLTITRTVDPMGERRARFTEEVEGGPQGFLRFLGPLIRPVVERSIRRDFARLGQLLGEEDNPPSDVRN